MTEERIKQRFEAMAPFLDERQRRLFAAAEAVAYGSGGQTRVARLLHMSTATVARGMEELQDPQAPQVERVRKPGGGRRRTVETDLTLRSDLERLVDPATRGEPDSPLRWTAKSAYKLAAELNQMGHSTSEHLVRDLLHEMGYSLQSNRKTLEGGETRAERADRDAQFEHINECVREFQAQGQPVISVDTKKKELVGQYKNPGQEWQPKGQPEQVKVHDFIDPDLGKVAPYGVYDLSQNNAWVSVGTDHDTAAFAVASIRTWWQTMGYHVYEKATRLLITADGGGSNGARNRLWKVELQSLADETGLEIIVCHFPPGTSKWNKIEHRLFSYITQNWRGRPLVSHEVVVNLIANTTTSTGLKVNAGLDTREYPTGIKVSDEELAAVNLSRDASHGEWNYTIRPHQTKSG
ncbi:MAG: ISAzo13 family transposase [Acidimicrobiales bacterium]